MTKLQDKYSLKFFKVNNWKTSTALTAERHILADFLDIWRDPREVKETLLPELNAVLVGDKQFSDIGADVVGVALIQKDVVELCGSEVGYQDYSLPSADFKKIDPRMA